MPLFLNCQGLDVFEENEETLDNLCLFVAQNGNPIIGYYGLPYFNYHFGDAQLIVRVEQSDDRKKLEIVGLDNHAAGEAIWKVRLSGVNMNRKDADALMRRVVVTRADGTGGMAIVNLVNADVLPSFLEDDLIEMQMVAFPEIIEYYPDEDSYCEKQPEFKKGKKLLLADGAVFATGMLMNRSPDSPKFETDERLDDIVNIRGTVKALYKGFTQFGEKEEWTFLRCVIDTEFGPLEIDHSLSQVESSQRDNIRVGSIVSFYGILSGDVAIHDYEKGIVRDEEHDLAALRYVFSGNAPERLRSILNTNAIYHAEYNGATFNGCDEIIERIKVVHENHSGEERYYAHFATIVSIDDGDEALPYSIGKRCLVLASGKETNYESIAFVDTDEEGRIMRMVTSINPRYHFSIDQKPKRYNPFDGVKPAESVAEPILLRARFNDIIDESVSDEEVLSNTESLNEYENNIQELHELIAQAQKEERTDVLQNVFGYLFAKAIEMEYNRKESEKALEGRDLCSYSIDDVWNGKIHSELPPEQDQSLKEAFELGKQFYKDFSFFQESRDDQEYDKNLQEALLIIQILGKHSYDKWLCQ